MALVQKAISLNNDSSLNTMTKLVMGSPHDCNLKTITRHKHLQYSVRTSLRVISQLEHI